MKVLSLLIIWSLPLFQPEEHAHSLPSPGDQVCGVHAGVRPHAICLDRHQDDSCPCRSGDDSFCRSSEDDDTLEDLLLARDGLHSWARNDLNLILATAAAGGNLPCRAGQSRPLRC